MKMTQEQLKVCFNKYRTVESSFIIFTSFYPRTRTFITQANKSLWPLAIFSDVRLVVLHLKSLPRRIKSGAHRSVSDSSLCSSSYQFKGKPREVRIAMTAVP